MSQSGFVFLLCTSEVLTMASTMYFPALLPQFKAAWNFDNAQAGWINGIFFRGYALTAPFLVSLTDKVHPGKAISAGYALGIFAGPWLSISRLDIIIYKYPCRPHRFWTALGRSGVSGRGACF